MAESSLTFRDDDEVVYWEDRIVFSEQYALIKAGNDSLGYEVPSTAYDCANNHVRYADRMLLSYRSRRRSSHQDKPSIKINGHDNED